MGDFWSVISATAMVAYLDLCSPICEFNIFQTSSSSRTYCDLNVHFTFTIAPNVHITIVQSPHGTLTTWGLSHPLPGPLSSPTSPIYYPTNSILHQPFHQHMPTLSPAYNSCTYAGSDAGAAARKRRVQREPPAREYSNHRVACEIGGCIGF